MMEAEILKIVPETTIYGKINCKFCDEAKKAFSSVELPFEYKDLAEEISMPDAMGEPRLVPKDWRTSGLVDLMANWARANCPTPLIVVNGVGYPNLAAALTAIGYRERKRAILQRKKDESAKEADPRADA